MNNIEKLAIEHGKASNTVMRYNEMSQQMLLDGYTFTKGELEAFAKALQSSEPVAWRYRNSERGDFCYMTNYPQGCEDASPFDVSPLFTRPPATVPLEKYNKVVDVRKDAERMDFIEKKFCGLSDSERYLPFRIYWGSGNNKTLRQVIDQAIDKARG